MRNIFSFLLLLITTFFFSQCLSGNCKNGVGKFDYGYAVYEGSFKNSQPDGKGKMDYGGGEFFEGDFVNGKEHGSGTLTKKGISKQVRYNNGKIDDKELVYVGGNPIKVDGCVKGDCNNGYGEIKFPSGNFYAGNFKSTKKHGEGKFTFASGNYFQGTFVEEFPTHGKFYYAKEKVSFTGSVDKEGIPASGVYEYYNNSTVTIENKKITKIYNPEAENLKKEMEEYAKSQHPVQCPVCQGDGISGYSRTTYVYQSPNYSKTDRYLYGEYTTHTRQGASFPNICTKCGGTGRIKAGDR